MKWTAKFATLATLMAVFALSSSAHAQAVKVGSANVQKVFADIKETKDLQTKLSSKGNDLNAMKNDAQKQLTDLKAQRDQFKPGTDTYDRANQTLSRTATELQVKFQVVQQELMHEQKYQTKMIYDKIVTVVGELAKEKGYTLVVSQIVPPEPSDDQFERLTMEQLSGLLTQQNLLYVDPAADLTAEVTTRMDAKYVSPAGAAAAPAPAAPAPAPGK